MDWYIAVVVVASVVVSYMLGRGSANGDVLTIKRDNEALNAELKRLTDRDERGRFTGSKK